MIPEYKLYHGAVLADIVDRYSGAASFRELGDPGRLLNYVVNERIGMQIKYSTARLRPWNFSYPDAHIDQLRELLVEYPRTFVVLVCRTDGFVSIPGGALLPFLLKSKSGQGWLRVNRKKREMYRLYGSPGEFDFKIRTTSEPIVELLSDYMSNDVSDLSTREPSSA